MKLIIAPRRGGKTSRLIEECRKSGGTIVCGSTEEVKEIQSRARHWGIHISTPITYYTFVSGNAKAGSPAPYHIDNLDRLLRFISRGSRIGTVTVDGGDELQVEEYHESAG